jgi:hypothetical protein
MIGLALALDEARTIPLGCLPKLRMTGGAVEPFWEPDQPTQPARRQTAAVLWWQTQAQGTTKWIG